MLIVVGAAIIRNGKILLVRERWSLFWTFPGGTLKPGDRTYEDCLAREIQEELPDLRFRQRNFRFFGIFPGWTSHGDEKIKLIVYRVLRAGEKIRPGSEITETAFTNRPESFSFGLASATREAIAVLRREGYLQ